MKNKRLSDREYEIMQILWNSQTPLLASEIVKKNEKLSINTVQVALRKLLAQNYVQIADVLQTGKGLGRTFLPTITADEYLLLEFKNILPASTERRNMFFAAFMEETNNKEQELLELEKMIAEYRKGLVK